MSTLIQGGQVCLDTGCEEYDILFDGQKITRIGHQLEADASTTIVDAAGSVVMPGMIDFHVHMDDRIGSFKLADSFHSGSQAAVLSGITTLISFVTQDKTHLLSECIQIAADKVKGKSYCDVAFHLTPTRFRDEDWANIRELEQAGYHTFKFYTTYREAGLYQDYENLKRILMRINGNGLRVLVHAEDQETLDQAASSYNGKHEPFAHTLLRPPESEARAIAQLIGLSRETGVPIHIVHVSTAEGARLIQDARADTQISCETAPQYLFLNEDSLKGNSAHRFLCTPPLRSEENRAQMADLVTEGCFDIFATDHCAFTRHDKDLMQSDFLNVPNGLAGTGALFPLVYELLSKHSEQPLNEAVRRLSLKPAQLSGLFPDKGTIRVGADADIVILNPNGEERTIHSSLSDCYETYPTKTTKLDFKKIFVGGELTVENNELVNTESPSGKVLGVIA